jgi:hypothetical protein
MPECRCPKRHMLISVASSEFGMPFLCKFCGFSYTLDVGELAHFKLPNSIRIILIDKNGNSACLSKVTIEVEYGYKLPLLQTGEKGTLIITKDIFEKAMSDEINSGLMDHKGDYSLNRYVTILATHPDIISTTTKIDLDSVKEKIDLPISIELK